LRFFTIGYGGRKPQQFIDLLAKNGIKAIVDVRLRPDRSSMGAYAKARSDDKGIQKVLADSNIGYYSMPELGNLFLDFDDWRERFRELLLGCGELLLDRLYTVDIPKPFCLLCAEKRAADCHRKQIADYLITHKGWTVEHIE